MELSPRQQDGTLILSPQGRIDHASADAFSAALAPHLAAQTGGVILLDFAGIDYISSVGLRALMLAQRELAPKQAKIAIASLTPVVLEVFTISRFNQVFKLFDNVEQAISALGDAA